jgi:hypothetical protein
LAGLRAACAASLIQSRQHVCTARASAFARLAASFTQAGAGPPRMISPAMRIMIVSRLLLLHSSRWYCIASGFFT